MKPLKILPVILLFMPMRVHGQEYVAFPVQGAAWHIYLESTCDNDSPPDTFLLRYKLDGDTIINDKAYRTLLLEKGDTINPIVEPAGGLREEGKKVYYTGCGFLGCLRDDEMLLYDFNAHVGDTIVHSQDGFWKSVVLDIDSVQIGETYRKRYEVDNGWYYHRQDYIIEGIGSVLNGLLGHITDIPLCGYHYWEHVCFIENGQVIYRNPAYPDCYAGVNLSSCKPDEYSGFRIFPNPFTETIEVTHPYPAEGVSFQLFSTLGQMILEKSISYTYNRITVPLPAGIYVAVLKDTDGTVLYKERIVRE